MLTLPAFFPTLHNNMVSISLFIEQPSEGHIKFFDVNGQLVLTQEFSSGSGETLFPISIANLQSGLYFIEVSSGKKIETLRFTKQ